MAVDAEGRSALSISHSASVCVAGKTGASVADGVAASAAAFTSTAAAAAAAAAAEAAAAAAAALGRTLRVLQHAHRIGFSDGGCFQDGI